MKIVKIILLIILVLIVLAAAGAFIFIKTFDINKYKPELTAKISEQFGRDVELGTIGLDLSLTRGVSIDIAGITAAEDPAFGGGPFLTVEQVRLNVSILAYLENREILVTQVELNRPQVRIIKNEQEQFNFSSMVPNTQEPASGAPGGRAPGEAPAVKPAAKPAAAPAVPDVTVESILVKEARVRYIDRSQQPALDVDAGQIDIVVKDFSLGRPFSFQVKAAVFSDRQNVTAEGKAQVDLVTNQVKLDRSRLALDIAATNLTKIPPAWLPPDAVDPRQKLQGTAEVNIAQVLAGPEGLASAAADVNARLQSFRLVSPPLLMQNIILRLGLTGRDAKIEEMSAEIASGQIAVTGEIRDYAGAQNYQLEIAADGISIKDILRQMEQDVPLAGAVQTRFRLSGAGLDDLQQKLQGKGAVSVSDGRLEEINVLRLILSRISILPNLVRRIETSLPPRYQAYLQERDTKFEKIDAAVDIREQKIHMPDIQLVSEIFSLQAQAELDFDQNIKFAGTVFIPADLSAAMIKEVGELEGLTQPDGQIRIPLSRYQGPAASMTVMPDMEYLGKNLLLNRGKQEIYKLLDKAIGRDQVPQEPSSGEVSPETPQQQTPQQKQRRPEKELIEGVFDAIFR